MSLALSHVRVVRCASWALFASSHSTSGTARQKLMLLPAFWLHPPCPLNSIVCREWADFDEKLGESVSIMGISAEFRTHKR